MPARLSEPVATESRPVTGIDFLRDALQSATLRKLGKSRHAYQIFKPLTDAQLCERLGFGEISDPRVQIEWEAWVLQVRKFNHVHHSDKDPEGLDWYNDLRAGWCPIFAGDPNAMGGPR
jgi:hypothetical protein